MNRSQPPASQTDPRADRTRAPRVYQLNPTDPAVDPRGRVIEIVVPHDCDFDLDEPLDVAIIGLLTELHGDAGDGERMPESTTTTAGGVLLKVTSFPPAWPVGQERGCVRFGEFPPDWGRIPDDILAELVADPTLGVYIEETEHRGWTAVVDGDDGSDPKRYR